VRELRNFIERVAIFEETRPITCAHLEATAARPGLHKASTRESAIVRIATQVLLLGGNADETIEAIRQATYGLALEEHGGNKSTAAEALGVNRMKLDPTQSCHPHHWYQLTAIASFSCLRTKSTRRWLFNKVRALKGNVRAPQESDNIEENFGSYCDS